jgi:clan AA aspartic protease
MGEIRTKVKLTNAVDDALASMGQLAPEKVRSVEVEAIVDTGAIASVLPIQIVEQIGLLIRGHRVAKYADGRNDSVGVTTPILFEILNRNTVEEAFVLGDEVLIGQTILEKLDLLADCAGRQVIPNPAHPNQPVLNVR